MPPAAPARGLFRIDGSGDEYAGGVCGGFDFGRVEEGGGGEKAGGLDGKAKGETSGASEGRL